MLHPCKVKGVGHPGTRLEPRGTDFLLWVLILAECGGGTGEGSNPQASACQLTVPRRGSTPGPMSSAEVMDG